MDRNVDRAFGISLSVITYGMFLAIITVMYVTAYKFFDLKVQSERMNQSLVKTDGYIQENEDLQLYTGNSTKKINKYTDSEFTGASDYGKVSGEVVTGAAVFAELLSLPDEVLIVEIDGEVLGNEPERYTEETTLKGRPNIAYYIARGETQKLGNFNFSRIKFSNVYGKFYTVYDKSDAMNYPDRIGHIKKITYQKLR